MGTPGSNYELIRETVSQKNSRVTIKELCEIAGVSRSGYYRWLAAADSRKVRDEQDKKDFEVILRAYRHRGYQKGARGIHMRLLHENPPVRMNVKKIRRIMKKFQLFCTIRKANPYRRMMKAMKTSNAADNLLQREFDKHGPRKVLLTDITYILYNSAKCYLSTILDAYTKQVLAYVISESLEVDFVLETVNQLVEKHGISLDAETLIHSDQGSHYTSLKFIQLVNDSGLRQSMSRRGNCWDNAPQESFFGHMKDEIDLSSCSSFADVCSIIDDWIDYYNNERYQWDLAKLSPNEFYEYCITGIYPLPVYQTDSE